MICTYKILIVTHFLCARYTLNEITPTLCMFCYACRSRYILYLVSLIFCQSVVTSQIVQIEVPFINYFVIWPNPQIERMCLRKVYFLFLCPVKGKHQTSLILHVLQIVQVEDLPITWTKWTDCTGWSTLCHLDRLNRLKAWGSGSQVEAPCFTWTDWTDWRPKVHPD